MEEENSALLFPEVKILEEGRYEIPDNCRALLVNGKTLVVRKRLPKKPQDRAKGRCKDCKYWRYGMTRADQQKVSMVCGMKPKYNEDGKELFYSAAKYDYPCDKFEWKGY